MTTMGMAGVFRESLVGLGEQFEKETMGKRGG